MKKSIAIILSLVLMMTVVFFGCGKKEESAEANEEETTQQTGGEGLTQSNAPIDGSSDAADVTNATDATDASDPAGTTDPTAATDNVNDVTAATDVTDATKPSEPDNNNQQTVAPQSNTKTEKYRSMFSSGTYSMTITTVNDGVEDTPVDFACKNGNLYMSMTMEGFPATVIYMADNDTVYMLFEMMGKFYTELTEELMGEEIDFSEATEGFNIPADAVITPGTGTFDGKTVYAETVTSGEKSSVFYFDDNGTLIGIETTDDNGTSSVSKLSNISSTVDDSVFEIPSEYKYMDLSWLMSMA